MEQQSTELKLTVPWGHVAARTYGSPTGKFVLMVHGLLDNLGTFTRLMRHLPTEYYYVCIDLPGHGRSSHFPSWMPIDVLSYVHAIHYILKALQWKTCIYIGHSMGAQIAVLFSIIQPHRIEKLIALDGLVPIPPETESRFMESFKQFFKLPLKTESNDEPYLYTKDEVLYALKNMRFAVLNSDAAEALFERAVTEVNGKYKYNRDIRLKRMILTLLRLEELVHIVSNLSVPLYLFVASHGVRTRFRGIFRVIESINSNSLIQLLCIKGNHDFHNNSPESIAPHICKILHSDNFSKL